MADFKDDAQIDNSNSSLVFQAFRSRNSTDRTSEWRPRREEINLDRKCKESNFGSFCAFKCNSTFYSSCGFVFYPALSALELINYHKKSLRIYCAALGLWLKFHLLRNKLHNQHMSLISSLSLWNLCLKRLSIFPDNFANPYKVSGERACRVPSLKAHLSHIEHRGKKGKRESQSSPHKLCNKF